MLMTKLFSRQMAAHVCVVVGIFLIGFGISIVNLGAGLACAGVAWCAYGYLLGAE